MRFLPLKVLTAAGLLLVLVLVLVLNDAAPAAGTRDRSFTPRTVTATVTRVRHADVLTLNRLHVRLEGIAAPRLGTPLGVKAVALTTRLALRKRVICRLTGGRFGDAEIGTCRATGQDLARALIREGLARSCPRIGLRRYTFHEARAAKTGIAEAFPLPAYCGPDPARANPDAVP